MVILICSARVVGKDPEAANVSRAHKARSGVFREGQPRLLWGKWRLGLVRGRWRVGNSKFYELELRHQVSWTSYQTFRRA